MIKGKRVYDPVTNTWSTGYWIPCMAWKPYSTVCASMERIE